MELAIKHLKEAEDVFHKIVDSHRTQEELQCFARLADFYLELSDLSRDYEQKFVYLRKCADIYGAIANQLKSEKLWIKYGSVPVKMGVVRRIIKVD